MGANALQLTTSFNDQAQAPEIRAALDTLARIPQGRAIVNMLRDNSIYLSRNAGYTGSATTFVSVEKIKNGRVTYSHLGIHFGALPAGNMVQALVHEAVHIRQHLEQRGYPDRILSQRDHIAFARAQEAEAQAQATHIAWQLKQAGYPNAYTAVKQVGYGDIAQAYEGALGTGKDPVKAAKAAWYNNPTRLANYDADIKNHLIPYFKGLLKNNPGHGLAVKKVPTRKTLSP